MSRSSPMTSLVLTDSSQLTADGFEKLPDQIMYPYVEPYDLQKHVSNPSKKAVCEPLVVSQELNELFQLVTDQGFLHEPRVVWESLSNIENDGYFVDGHFMSVPQNALETSSVITHQQLIGHE
uniref:Ubiquitin carboxyl-terminal hydrolase n=1 Tax=Timema tahoe TaxID=61484 RepID=A0A7R9NXW2_9NEOP|nr:unnamed protein product [Timema tahoe]